MLENSLFEYRSYKTYLNDWILAQPQGGRGEKSRLAKALQCHPAYISLVLKGDSDFSLEQGEKVSEFLHHAEEETHYFLLLLQSERAGTRKLKAYFQKQIEQTIQQHLDLKRRLKTKQALGIKEQMIYYSAWYYSAIDAALSVPGLRTKEALQAYLGLPISVISKVLNFLLSVGLAEESAGRYQSTIISFHLGADSPMAMRSHANWRMRAVVSLDTARPEDLHYSSVVSVSAKDAEIIRERLVRAIEEIRNIVRTSTDEEVFCYNFDLFSLRQP